MEILQWIDVNRTNLNSQIAFSAFVLTWKPENWISACVQYKSSLMLFLLKITGIFPWPCFVPPRYEKPKIVFLDLPTLRKKRSKTMNTNKKCTPQRLAKIKLRLLHIFLFFLRKSLTFKNKMFRDSWEKNIQQSIFYA